MFVLTPKSISQTNYIQCKKLEMCNLQVYISVENIQTTGVIKDEYAYKIHE